MIINIIIISWSSISSSYHDHQYHIKQYFILSNKFNIIIVLSITSSYHYHQYHIKKYMIKYMIILLSVSYQKLYDQVNECNSINIIWEFKWSSTWFISLSITSSYHYQYHHHIMIINIIINIISKNIFSILIAKFKLSTNYVSFAREIDENRWMNLF